jgi:hypothetical protein
MKCAVFSALFTPVLMADAVARHTAFTQQPYTASPVMGFTYSFFGEGMEYNPSKDAVYLGSLGLGQIYSVPYYRGIEKSDNRVVYDKDDMTIVFDTATLIKYY